MGAFSGACGYQFREWLLASLSNHPCLGIHEWPQFLKTVRFVQTLGLWKYLASHPEEVVPLSGPNEGGTGQSADREGRVRRN